MNYPYFRPIRVKLQSKTKKNPAGDKSPPRKSALGLTSKKRTRPGRSGKDKPIKVATNQARRHRLNPARRPVAENRAAR